MKKQLLVLTTLFATLAGYSQTFIVNNITYNVISSNSVEITDYNPNGGTSVTIPSQVTPNVSGKFSAANSSLVTYAVTRIANQAFGNNGLTSVTIPNTVTNIGNSAFQSNQLTQLIIPSGVTSIGANAFTFNNLTCISSLAATPPTIFTGNGDTFGGCSSCLRSEINLIIPAGTTNAYNTASWTGFKSVNEGLGINDYFEVNNFTYQVISVNPNKVAVSSYDIAGGTTVNIPTTIIGACTSNVYTVTEIKQAAFQNLSTITSISIPNNVTVIGTAAFSGIGLNNIVLPSSLITIGTFAFSSNNLSNLTIPNGVTSIGTGAFSNNDLTTLTIPNSVTTIGNFTFSGNPLTDVYALGNIPATITTGNNDTFGSSTSSQNRSVIHLHIPAGKMGVYVTNPGALWTGFNQVTEDALLSTSGFELENDIKIIITPSVLQVLSPDNLRLEKFSLYTIAGSKVASGNTSEITTSYLANGFYILKLDFDQGSVVKKININK